MKYAVENIQLKRLILHKLIHLETKDILKVWIKLNLYFLGQYQMPFWFFYLHNQYMYCKMYVAVYSI